MGAGVEAANRARRLWVLYEHVHAVTYFAPEARAAYEDAGVRGFWRGYFAGRSAPMGRVDAGVVDATFFGFHPDVVARAIPSVWDMAPPEAVLAARAEGAAAALRAVLGNSGQDDAVAEATTLLADGIAECSGAGRPLYAANRALDWPVDPWAALWHATTLWREHRGDGHIAALVVAGIDGCASHVLRLAAAGLPASTILPARGWSDDDWQEASDRLAGRGLLEASGQLSDSGRATYQEIEVATDRAAAGPVRTLGERSTRLEELLTPMVAAIGAAGQMYYPNPIGVGAPPT